MKDQTPPIEEQPLLELVFDTIDNCDRALKMIGDDPSVREGVLLIRDCAVRDLSRLGYRSFPQSGDPFNPHRQEAIGLEGDPQGDMHVVEVQSRGWQRGERLVRAARVIVGELQGESDLKMAPTTGHEDRSAAPAQSPADTAGRDKASPSTSDERMAESDLSLGDILGGASPGEKARRRRR